LASTESYKLLYPASDLALHAPGWSSEEFSAVAFARMLFEVFPYRLARSAGFDGGSSWKRLRSSPGLARDDDDDDTF